MNRIRSLAIALPLPIFILGIWWLLSANSTSPYWPPLSTIFETFFETWFFERFWTDLMPSVGRFFAGFILALVLGVGLGVICGMVTPVRRVTEPFVDFMRSLPQPALIPIFIILLGVDSSMKIVVITLSAIWPILLNTIDGVRALESEKIAFAQVYGLDLQQRLTKLILPAASPQIFVGARLSLAIALIMMVVSEMIAATNGLGYFILLSQQTFAVPAMWAGIIMLGLIGYFSNVIFIAIETKILAWHRGWRAASLGEETPKVGQKRKNRLSMIPKHGQAAQPMQQTETLLIGEKNA